MSVIWWLQCSVIQRNNRTADVLNEAFLLIFEWILIINTSLYNIILYQTRIVFILSIQTLWCDVGATLKSSSTGERTDLTDYGFVILRFFFLFCSQSDFHVFDATTLCVSNIRWECTARKHTNGPIISHRCCERCNVLPDYISHMTCFDYKDLLWGTVFGSALV